MQFIQKKKNTYFFIFKAYKTICRCMYVCKFMIFLWSGVLLLSFYFQYLRGFYIWPKAVLYVIINVCVIKKKKKLNKIKYLLKKCCFKYDNLQFVFFLFFQFIQHVIERVNAKEKILCRLHLTLIKPSSARFYYN